MFSLLNSILDFIFNDNDYLKQSFLHLQCNACCMYKIHGDFHGYSGYYTVLTVGLFWGFRQ